VTPFTKGLDKANCRVENPATLRTFSLGRTT
jgi:hypothetical protein